MDIGAGKKSLYEDIFLFSKKQPDAEAVQQTAILIHKALNAVEKAVLPGVTTENLACIAHEVLTAGGAGKNIIIHTSVEDTAWHGLPSSRVLQSGEIVTVDIACSLNGWWSDSATSFPVGKVDEVRQNLLEASREAVIEICRALRPGDVHKLTSKIVSEVCRRRKVSLIPEGGGHGIGRRLHESPILTYDGHLYNHLEEGMVYTVEPVFTSGSGKITISESGAAVCSDGAPASHFEVSVLMEEKGARILGYPAWLRYVIEKTC